MKMVTKINAAAAMTAVALAVAGPAVASSYYSASSPLNAYEDSHVQAQMFGSFSLENQAYLRNDTRHRDFKPGGDSAFERTEYRYDFSDSQGFVYNTTDQSPKTTSSDWYYQYDHDGIPNDADAGRMLTQVCEDHGIYKDPCSVWPRQTFNF
ncbi:MAG: hypothetical protein JWQ74_651 [Marmoricola sp.]|nr:hypothetical protein [Marmoricola sp.]